MKLVTDCPGGHEVTLSDVKGATRMEISPMLTVTCPNHGPFTVYPYGIRAEPGFVNTGTGAIVGGILGLLGGPIGVLIGGTIGAGLGAGTSQSDQEAVRRFNNS